MLVWVHGVRAAWRNFYYSAFLPCLAIFRGNHSRSACRDSAYAGLKDRCQDREIKTELTVYNGNYGV